MKTIIILIITSLFMHYTHADNTNIKKEASGLDELIEFSGLTEGYNDYYRKRNKNRIDRSADEYVDFGLVLPSLTKKEILNFDLNRIISPKSDTLKIAGESFEVPSNLSLPKQKEYYILKLKINKPQYRAFVRDHDDYNLTVIHGKFEVEPVITKLINGQPIFDIINDFEFLGGGQLQINSKNKTSELNLDINDFGLTSKATINAPDYDNSQLTMISMPMESVNGRFHPTDLKYLEPGSSIDVATNNNGNPHYTLSIVTDQIKQVLDPYSKSSSSDPDYLYLAEFNKISMSFVPTEAKTIPQFLSITEKPSLSQDGLSLNLYPPVKLSNSTPTATVIEFVQAEQVKNGKLVSEHKTVLWSKTLNGWGQQVDLPQIKFTPIDKAIYRYEVSFIANNDDYTRSSEGSFIDNFSFLSKNYLVIK